MGGLKGRCGGVKILRELKGTGACQRSKNNRKLVIVVWLVDLASSPTELGNAAATEAVTRS